MQTDLTDKTVVIKGFDLGVKIKQDLRSLFYNCSGVEKIKLKDSENECFKIAYITCASEKDAKDLRYKFRRRKWRGNVLYSRYSVEDTYPFEIESSSCKKSKKVGRVIVRNIAWNVSLEELKDYFKELGPIVDISFPKIKSKNRGFAFIEFGSKSVAEKAVLEYSGTILSNREIAVDFAVPKEEYVNSLKEDVIDNEEPMEVDGVLSDEEISSPTSLKTKRKEKESVVPSKKKTISNDAEDGRTLFIRGLPFEVVDAELEECFKQYGDLAFGRVVIDQSNDHSRGTGFVRFKDLKGAENCLKCSAQMSGITLNGRKLLITTALSKNSLQSNVQDKKERIAEDRRNLHLARVGFIRPGGADAAQMSKHDAELRKSIETSKRKKLKNLNMVVSPVRLCIHNLPRSITDASLKSIVAKSIEVSKKTKAIIKECRIMRDMSKLDSEGKGRSLGYAFIELVNHHYALQVLERLNNNPEPFGDQKRPIVEFSIQHKRILQRLQLRSSKSELEFPIKHALSKRELKDRIKNPIPKNLGEKHRNKEQFRPTRKKKIKDKRKESVSSVSNKSSSSAITAKTLNSQSPNHKRKKTEKEKFVKEKKSVKIDKIDALISKYINKEKNI